MAKASATQLDFTNVKEGGSFNKRHQAPGDYKAKVTKVADEKSKKDGVKMWLFTIEVGSGTYPLYCKHEENQLWKIRNLFVAAGINVPKKRVNVDPNKVVGKTIAVTLEDDEYEGKMQSTVAATFPVSELEATEDEGDDDEDDTEEDTPSADDDDDEDEEEAPQPKAKKKKEKKAKEASQGSTPGDKKKAKKVDDVDDSELEELEIEDI
jgi:hypothetical protein